MVFRNTDHNIIITAILLNKKWYLTFSISGQTFNFLRTPTASLVFLISSTLSSRTSGNSGTLSTMCPVIQSNNCIKTVYEPTISLKKVDRQSKQTFRHDQCRDSRSSNSRANGVTPLVNVNVAMPSSPGLGWGKHTTTSAHVSKSSLARPVGTTSTNTWNPSHGTTSTPWLSRRLMTLTRG